MYRLRGGMPMIKNYPDLLCRLEEIEGEHYDAVEILNFVGGG